MRFFRPWMLGTPLWRPVRTGETLGVCAGQPSCPLGHPLTVEAVDQSSFTSAAPGTSPAPLWVVAWTPRPSSGGCSAVLVGL